jgi:hypothetical protein
MNSIAYNEGYCCGFTIKCIYDGIYNTLCCCAPSSNICVNVFSCVYETCADCWCYGDYEYCLLCCAGFYNGFTRDSRNTNIVSTLPESNS